MTTGEISSQRILDYERQDLYTFYVTATDGGGLERVAMVRVNVLDVEDNVPIFERSSYVFAVDEQAAAVTVVGAVRVSQMSCVYAVVYMVAYAVVYLVACVVVHVFEPLMQCS